MSENRSLSRSELLRRRRQEKSRQQREPRGSRPFVKKSKVKIGYRELPPITARGVVNDFAIERRKKAGKRRFNAAISLTRTQGLPRPQGRALALPHIQIRGGWRWMSLFLTLLFGTGLYLFWSLPDFRVTAAQVTGNQRIPADEINSLLGLDGYPVFLLTPDQIRIRALRNFPELASVDVTVSLPNIVTVNVTERQPIIQWQQDGGYTWIDETGIAILPRGEAPGLIIVQALSAPPSLLEPKRLDLDPDESDMPEQAQVSVPEDDLLTPVPFISMETVKALKALAPHIPPGTSILYDQVTGLSWADGGGWQAVFGHSGDDMETKVLVYQAMVDWLVQRGIRPILINVAYPSAPFYRVEQVEVEAEVEEQ